MPFGMSRQWHDAGTPIRALRGFAVFCLLSSQVLALALDSAEPEAGSLIARMLAANPYSWWTIRHGMTYWPPEISWAGI